MTQLYQHIAKCLRAHENCRKTGNTEWLSRHGATINHLVDVYMPSGSGIDRGTKLDFDRSKPNRLVFTAPYHHMNDGGMYDGWTDHDIIVYPDLSFGFDLYIGGRNRNQIKDYLGDTFAEALRRDVADDEYRAACGVTD